MISAGEFRKGVTFEYESGIFTIVDFQHVKPGKGAAFVRTKMKNVVRRASSLTITRLLPMIRSCELATASRT